MGYERINEPIIAPSVVDYTGAELSGGGGGSGNSHDLPFVAGTSVTVDTATSTVRKAEYDLAGWTIDILQSAQSAGRALVTCPSTGGKILLGMVLDLTDITLSGDFQSTPTVRMGVGTTEIVGTISGTEENILADTTLSGSGLTGRSINRRMADLANPTTTLKEIPRGTSLFLNSYSSSIDSSGTGVLTVVAGSMSIYYVEVEDPTNE